MAGTLHKLTAGSGYDYLTRQVARQDATEVGHSGLANYYAKGEAPGVWVGSGLAGIEGLAAGDVVTAEQMTRLFGTGEHPLGEKFGDLGRVYPVYHGRDDVSDFRIEVARRCQELNRSLGLPANAPVDVQDRAKIRTQVAHEMFRERYGRDPLNQREVAGFIAKESRPRTTAVAGYDLTFSPVKSVSTLWAVADLALSEQIERAHQDAVGDALRFIEDNALFTRTGTAGVAQVDVTGLVGAAFTHRDSRAGDPDLHTHVAVANKVQTLDGRWLAIDGRVLYKAMVTASETYNTALEKHLAPLGIRFTERATEPGQDVRKRPIREILGVDPALNQRWSSRRVSIEARRRELAGQFQADHHRPPTQVESIQLAQQATLETRDAKHEPRSLAEQRATWRVQAEEVLGGPHGIEKMVSQARSGRVPNDREQVKANRAWRARTAGQIIDRVSSSRSTWQVWHLRAEAQRRVRQTKVPTEKVDALVETLTQAAVKRSVVIRGARADRIREPKVLRRQDGMSVYTVAGSQQFTSTAVLEAERRIVEAAGRADGRQVARADVDLALVESIANGVKLNAGQATLVRQMAASGARVQLAIAPAGSGKTTAMRALTKAWESSGGTVLGLAPSAAAAAALRENAETSTDTLAKLVYTLEEPDRKFWPRWVKGIDKDTLVVIDEAGMADTLTLDRAISYVLDQGASVRLIGDDQQLAAIGAGGVLRDIRTTHGSLHLTELMRFADAAEGGASLALREGQVESLGFYLDQRRVHVGDMSTMTEAVFDAWSADRGKGKDSIMLAPTRELVSELNQRARAHRLDGVDDTGPGATLADGNRASIGDTVISRMNKRKLKLSPTDWVKNGDRWTVLDVDDEGALLVQHTRNKRTINLPADYVAEAVELGYASTVHSAQGVSVDSMHGLASGEESRQQLYTMMTRGKYANHLYLEVVGDGDEHNTLTPHAVHPRTATDLLESILARDEAPTSATTLLREADEPAPLLAEATARYTDSLYTAAAQLAGPERLARLDETAEDLVPGLTGSLAWPTLRAHLSLVAAGGHSPFQALHEAATVRELDTAADPAAVIGWRLDDSGLRNAGAGPLPWVPGVPTALAEHPIWGPYLAERAARIRALADDVTAQTCQGAASGVLPSWIPQGHEAPSPDLLGKVAVWRAANGVAEDDHRPTGPQVLAVAPANYQRELRSQLAGGATPASAEWLPLLHGLSPIITADTFASVLSERLAALSRAGIDAAGITRAAAEKSPLPDDHAAGALWWRIHGQLAPAVAAQIAGDITIDSDWTPTLATHLGANRVSDLQASPWWPALVTSIDNALGRGWALEDLASTAPARDVDVDPAAAMTWQIAILTDPPVRPEDGDGSEPGPAAEDLVWAAGTPIPQSIQATDAEWVDHLETTLTEPGPVTEQAPFDPGEVSAALALSAMVRTHLGQLEPSDADLDRVYDRQMAAAESPVPLARLAQVNQAALDFYTDQLVRGGWARGYLADRLGHDFAGDPHVRPGYAPAGWTRLLDHLRGLGYTDTDLSVSGLAATTKDGRLIDRFRDRAVFPITSTTGQVLGFIGRRNPEHNDDTPHAGPKYLNTPTTPLFAKGDQLYGTDPHLLAAGATPVLVEGPMDAHAITLATRGAYIGLAPLGTALTEAQAAQLAGVGGPVIIATDADLGGRMAAERDHWLLAQHNVATHITHLPEGADPSSLLTDHGSSALLDRLLTPSPLVDTLLAERLANLPPDQALAAAATVLATAHPSAWEAGVTTIAQATGTDEDTARSHLLRAVRHWHDDPRSVVADQLAATGDVRARLEHAQDRAQTQAPEERWSTIAASIDPRLPQEPDWPALANVMQHLHENGHDVEAAARESANEDPLGRQPAQDLRYRLIVINPPQQAPHCPAAVTGVASERRRLEQRDPAVRDRGRDAPRR